MTTVLVLLSAGRLAAAPGDIGVEGNSYLGVGPPHPSAEKPESKLWFNDDRWWASMWSVAASDFTIHMLDPATQTWVDTGTVTETDKNYRQDVLWDGTKLYVASHKFSKSPAPGFPATLKRYSYDSGTRTYSLDGSAVINDYKTETLVIDKDSTGQLWATWTQDNTVYVNQTVCTATCDDFDWNTPTALTSVPGGSGAAVVSDDISSLIAFGGNRIGIMWSNQSSGDDSFHFAVHDDSAADGVFTFETISNGSSFSDDHINLATYAGEVFAAVKTSFDSNGSPETMLLKRSTGGTWSMYKVTDGADNKTRPIVVVDSSQNLLHFFVSDVAGGKTYQSTSPISSPAFGPLQPVMFDADADDMNDATSTKQLVSAGGGLVVVSTDNVSKTYWHMQDQLGGGQVLAAGFTATPVAGEAPVAVAFTDQSTGSPTGWTWDFGDGTTDTTQNPTHTYTTPGTYTVTLTVTDGTGTDTLVATNYIVATDETTFTATQDAHVKNTSPGSNYGDLTFLRIRGASTTVYRSFVQFDVTGIPTGTPLTATLRMYVTDPSPDAGDVHLVADNNWHELSITDNTAPAVDPAVIAGGGEAVFQQWVEWDVTGAVTGDGTYTFAIVSDNGNSAFFSSKEGTHPPELLIGSAGSAPLGAQFSSDTTSGEQPLVVAFTDLSTGSPTGWTWDFGDGTTDTTQNPTHTYTTPGTYTVTLTVTDGTGTDTLVRTDYVTVTPPQPLAAGFTSDTTTGPAPLAVSFTDQSTGSPTGWTWDFGDGTTDTTQNPTHTYTTPGTYTVTLTVTDGTGTDTLVATNYIAATDEVTFTPVADAHVKSTSATKNYGSLDYLRSRAGSTEYQSYLKFDVQGLPAGAVQATLRMFATDGSPSAGDVYLVGSTWTETGITYDTRPLPPPTPVAVGGIAVAGQWYEWDVSDAVNGDGTYSFAIVSNSSNSVFYDSREGLNPPQLVLTTSSDLSAQFGADTTTGPAPLTVTFTDQSSGSPTGWTWDFGDGTTDTTQNPTHTYTTPGTYTVTLTVTDGVDTISKTRTDYITVEALTAAFTSDTTTGPAPLAVTFTDQSTGSPTGWTWDFGDGTTDTTQNPTHTYTTPGTYTVTLTITDGTGTDTLVATNYIAATDESLVFPVADAHVKSTSATKNYGSLGYLRARSGSTTYNIYLKFDVQGLPAGAVQATLRMFATDGSPSAGDVYLVGSTWTETGITYDTRPLPPPTPVAVGGPATTGQWYEWDVSDAVDGDGTYSFAIVSNSSNSVYYDSREGLNPPQLVLATSNDLAAQFGADTTTGPAPLTVTFTDQSSGSPTGWTWDFGDGTTDTTQNPTHTYTTPGTYTVTLTVTDGVDTISKTRTDYITVEALTAAFTSDTTTGPAPLTVTFTDQSTGSPTGWTWDFGDGTTDTTQNPTHTYTTPGTYTVTLTVTDGTGTDTLVATDYIAATDDVSFVAVADTHVKSGSPDKNYGSLGYVRIRSSATNAYQVLVKFDVTGLGSPTSVKLRMYVTDPSPSAGDLYVVDSTWDETTVTWNTAPVVIGVPVATGGAATAGQWYEWDVTAVVTADGTYSFALVSNSGNSAYFDSREATNQPHLLASR